MVYEDDECLAFLDIYPIAEGHVLVIPKKHCVILSECDEETAKNLIAVVKKLNSAVCSAVGCEGILNEVRNGAAAGQEVPHLHFHIIPRRENDGFGWVYPPGYREKMEAKGKLDEIASNIKKKM